MTRLDILTILFSHRRDLRSRIVVFRRSLSSVPRWRAATRWFSAVTTAAMACPTVITAISMDTLDPPDTKFCRRSRFRYTRYPPRRFTWTHLWMHLWTLMNYTATNITPIKITIITWVSFYSWLWLTKIGKNRGNMRFIESSNWLLSNISTILISSYQFFITNFLLNKLSFETYNYY